jgi:hypothetical protein
MTAKNKNDATPPFRVEEPRSEDSMVPLFEAAALAFRHANGKHTDDAAMLNKVARIIARHSRLFTRAHDQDHYSLVMPSEVEEGMFQLGGAYLEFPDGRPSLGNLSILRRELSSVLSETRELIPGLPRKGRKG